MDLHVAMAFVKTKNTLDSALKTAAYCAETKCAIWAKLQNCAEEIALIPVAEMASASSLSNQKPARTAFLARLIVETLCATKENIQESVQRTALPHRVEMAFVQPMKIQFLALLIALCLAVVMDCAVLQNNKVSVKIALPSAVEMEFASNKNQWEAVQEIAHLSHAEITCVS